MTVLSVVMHRVRVCVPSPLAAYVVLHSLCMWLDESDVMGGGERSCGAAVAQGCGIIGHSHTIPDVGAVSQPLWQFGPINEAHDCGVHVLTRTSCAVQSLLVQQRVRLRRLQHTCHGALGAGEGRRCNQSRACADRRAAG